MRTVKDSCAKVAGIHIISLIFLSFVSVFISVHPARGLQESSLAPSIPFAINAQKDILKVRHNRFAAMHRNRVTVTTRFVVQDCTSVSGQSAVLRDTAYAGTAVHTCGERSPPFSSIL